jgi:hypothetical protein
LEYALIGLLLFILCIPALTLLGQNIYLGFNNILPPNKPVNSSVQPVSSEAAASPEAHGFSTPIAAVNGNASSNISAASPVVVQTVGSNGNIQAVWANVQNLETWYAETTDPSAQILLAQLLRAVSAPPGGEMTTKQLYALGDVSVISAKLAELRSTWTTIKGSQEFRQLSTVDQQRLTQLMNDFQTQEQYFTHD